MKVDIVKWRDKDETEIRTLVFKEHTIRITQWRSPGFRLVKKHAEVLSPMGVLLKTLNTHGPDNSFHRFASNAKIFADGRAVIRDLIDPPWIKTPVEPNSRTVRTGLPVPTWRKPRGDQ